MLVDQMEYQGQQGSGGPQDDAFYELLSSTALANAKKQQQQQHQFEQQNHQQQQQQQFDSRSEEGLPNYDFQSTSSSYGGVVANGEDMRKAPSVMPVVESSHPPHFPTYPPGSSYSVIASLWIFAPGSFGRDNPNLQEG